jgi:hypothetical protein
VIAVGPGKDNNSKFHALIAPCRILGTLILPHSPRGIPGTAGPPLAQEFINRIRKKWSVETFFSEEILMREIRLAAEQRANRIRQAPHLGFRTSALDSDFSRFHRQLTRQMHR